ncbi:MAG: FKBP-type peptidyl-prolyl cis-trans isomerase [Gammaproteobacteria bacterium]|nr:FKBP-type peptidyl-prolyl cis-trans isomerase [Gammaproteobacteria bacterium]MCP5317245.1 FKBP-type peptidyl-prolyl cis-trans isomerase [Chromatiaceae bacterium]MCW5586433.1 FKBP-type peptidyl-prolyl cis-trans isomerase [Chromatiales bacterium]MCB1816462.1 FKBP-type peptidyl-prolyl cis-trans isomerase [Gammaproteobacteria bacterium]MCP5430789.1 FKBP-type peptidyl-prolyl cis-trans isomerase [Chromatiaceae bacterium]
MSDQIIKRGKYVALTYTIEDEHGTVVEQHDLPLGFVYGSDTELIGGMDKAVAGKSVGDQVEVDVSPDQGFGEPDPSLTFTDSLDNVPPQFRQVGAEVQMQNDKGETKSFFVTRIEDGQVTVDGNHPLAGKALKVRVTITEVRDARPGEEQVSGIHAVKMPGPASIN